MLDEIELTDNQKLLAKSLKISERFLRLLLARGLSEDELQNFLYPSINGMSSPFDIDGIAAACERIERAIKNGESILIFGDYDCDGICSVAILMLYLQDKAADVTYFIPERKRDGYGMSVATLKNVISAKKPNLLIAVDCGVTANAEVDFLLENGIDVIVTDHHEPQGCAPNCIVVDPKIARRDKMSRSKACNAGVCSGGRNVSDENLHGENTNGENAHNENVCGVAHNENVSGGVCNAEVTAHGENVSGGVCNAEVTTHGENVSGGIEKCKTATECGNTQSENAYENKLGESSHDENASGENARVGFCEFCGAGVALKLVEALGGRNEAVKYLDIAAIATIADVVPLVGENRIIARFGLAAIRYNPRGGLKMLIGTDKQITSQDVMFNLAPKMNAAGRLNSAMKVVDVFLEKDYFMLKSLSDELERDNTRRQEICEDVVREAKTMLRGTDFNTTRFIILENDNWEAGVLGIAAARLVEEFKCPSLLLSKSEDGALKGSARSIPSVNIFELLSSFSSYFTGFGGHAQAAGVNMSKDKPDAFREAVNAKLCMTHDVREFFPKLKCETALDIENDALSFARELEMLEPTGFGNPKQTFLITGDDFKFEPMGLTPHVKCAKGDAEIVGFYRYAYAARDIKGRFEIEAAVSLNEFQNVVKAQAVVKSMNITEIEMSKEDFDLLNLHQLKHEACVKVEAIDKNGILALLEKPFGTLIVCFIKSEYENICKELECVKELPFTFVAQKCLNTVDSVVLAPSETFDFSYYSDVIVAGRPLSESYIAHIAENTKRVFIFGDCMPRRLNVCDGDMRKVYIELKNLAKTTFKIKNTNTLYDTLKDKISLNRVEFFAVLEMLLELKLISISDRGIISVSTNKTDLKTSVIYNNICSK